MKPKQPIRSGPNSFFLTLIAGTLLLLFGGCGGGGGGLDTSDDGPVAPQTLPNLLQFSVFGITGMPYIISVGLPSETTIDIMKSAEGHFHVGGTYQIQTGETTIEAPTIIDMASGEDFFGPLRLHVDEQARWYGTDDPLEGKLRIQYKGHEFVTATAIATGVRIEHSDDSEEMSWERFDDLVNDPTAPEWQAVAAFGYQFFRFFMERVGMAFDFLRFIVENSGALQNAGDSAIREWCDPFPPDDPEPEIGIKRIRWIDDNVDGNVGYDDKFSISYADCWMDDPDDDLDYLFNGGIFIDAYYGSSSPFFLGAHFVFGGLEVTETEEDYSLGYSSTTTGGFALHLSQP